ncbi:MAG: 4-hydroxythreonine-4-phosphate dehydrogenase PdxA [Desulfobacterales bacterium]|jgi:4-hydroxythreonine-4-phosphate dehydrogenase|nr:4-hydroxythreonine-4-phosphate dehydrogenase PdxA [Desulfobacterales bacterium]
MGDPAGIGPEIIVKALSMEEPFQACQPFVFGDREVLSKTIEMLGLTTTVEVFEKIPEEGYLPQRIFLSPLSQLEVDSFRFGKPDTKCGEAMVKYVEEAVKWVRSGKLDAITTCPINKKAINAAGYPFSGHTELLAHLVKANSVAMMFLGSRWKIVLVTTHLPLKEVSQYITFDRILSTIRMTDEGLRKYFGMTHPRIAVLGLNPHCGEDGLLGEEEKMEIIPAIAEARSQGMDVEGPFPADSFFNFTRRTPFDAVISMYHDQGLIPIKMVDFEEAVNLTLGLPFIRTSVGHGTAYDIAGKGLANPTNLIKALLMASKLSKLKRDY